MVGSAAPILVALVVSMMALPAQARVPRDVAAALDAWTVAVTSGDVERIASLMAPGDTLEIQSGLAAAETLTPEALRARLLAGEANRLGLSKALNLPVDKGFRRRGNEYTAAARDCPEVEWTFVRVPVHDGKRSRARLIRIRRVFLDC